MEQLIELLQQIQELAGAGIDALKEASGGKGKPEGPPEGEPGGKPPGGDQQGAPEPGGKPPDGDEGGRPGGGKPPEQFQRR